jgi:16S rRNA (guanine(966)-N(2))-methyltransferase RsmD
MSGIRVIAGTAKGRKLHRVPDKGVRPIGDRVKEALFNIIGVEIRGSTFLDLFAGTGSVGIEAISRGAEHAVFVDNNRRSIETIHKNLALTKLEDKASVLLTDALALPARSIDRTYDFVYVAPPQYHGIWVKAMLALDNHPDVLNPDAWVIAQIDPREAEPVGFKHLTEFDRRKYGNTLLLFFVLETE